MSSEPPSRAGSSKKKKANQLLWDPVFEPLVSYMIASNAIPIRQAVEVGKRAVEYMRAKDVVKFVMKKDETLRAKFPGCFDDSKQPLTTKQAERLADELCRLGFVYRADYKPLSERSSLQSAPTQQSEAGRVENLTPKWPKRLQMSTDQRFDVNAFYILRYEPKSAWPHIYLGLIIGAVLVVCLFPAWPLAFKLFAWYASFSLTTFIFGSIVLRLIAFIGLWFFGVDFWIFPNLFDEEVGVIDSFKPLVSWLKRDDDWSMLAARIFLGILMIGTGYGLSLTHSISDIQRFATQQFIDVLEWGHQKLLPPNSTDLATPYRAPPLDAASEDPTDGFRCLLPCGFETYELFKEECSYDCICMSEILTSHCFKTCPEAAKKALEETKVGSCQSDGIVHGEEKIGDNDQSTEDVKEEL